MSQPGQLFTIRSDGQCRAPAKSHPDPVATKQLPEMQVELVVVNKGQLAVGLAPLALLVDGPRLTDDPGALALLAYLGVLTMALAYALLYAGLRTTSGSAATVATLLEPVTAAAVAAVLLDERIGPLGLLGTALVLAAVAGLGREDPLVQPSGTALVAGRARPSPE